MKSEHRVLTPESVEFVYELGGLSSRMVAALVDHVLILVILGIIWLGALFTCMFTALVSVAVAFVLGFLVVYGYFVFFEWRWNGQTPGKRLMDLRVIDDRGMNVDLFQAAVRNLLRVVDLMPALLQLPVEDRFVPGGHYSPRANRRVAEVMAEAVRDLLSDRARGR